MGIDYKSFLNLTPKILNDAVTQKINYDNRMAHISGLYVYNALSAVIGTAFGKTKIPYISEPIPLTKEAYEEQEKANYEKNIAKFHVMRAAHNAKFKEE